MIIPPGTAMGTPVTPNVPEKPGLTMKAYHAHAGQTAIYPRMHAVFDRVLADTGDPLYYTQMEDVSILYPALKLAGEAGEFTEKLGKIIRDESGVISPASRIALLKELGDVLWYVSAAARELKSDLEEVAQMNLDKLAARAADGKLGGSGDER